MNIICLFLNHDFEYLLRLDDYSHLHKCKRCKRPFCTNTNVRITLPFDLVMQDFYRKEYPKTYKKAMSLLDKTGGVK